MRQKKNMNDSNPEENKNNFFRRQFDDFMIDCVNERFEFFKKIEENQSIKNLICRMMYSDYKKNRPLMVLGDSE